MYLWVVEMWNDKKRVWESTEGVGLSRKSGMYALGKWKAYNPDDEFRLTKYAPLAA